MLLEPDGHPPPSPSSTALVDDGIPYTSFAVDDVKAEYDRLRALGVRFTQEPLEMQTVTTAVLDDTCGNHNYFFFYFFFFFIATRPSTFQFSASESSSTFECSVDGGVFAPCSSPYTTPLLAEGAHTFAVRATDAADHSDPTPATRSFTVSAGGGGGGERVEGERKHCRP